MDIIYLGHASFKLRGKTGTVVTDPFDSKFVGFDFPKVSADIVTVSHAHSDHNNSKAVLGTTRRPRPFVVNAPGEYELQEISIFGLSSFHDNQQGAARGGNMISSITIEGIHIAHLGDLGHELDEKQISQLGAVDVLIVPVGGVFTITAKQAAAVVQNIEPAIVIPMHYKTSRHADSFAELATVETFIKEMGQENIEPLPKLTLTPGSLPADMEIVILKN